MSLGINKNLKEGIIMRLFFLLSLLMLNVGCATMSDVIRNKNNGAVRVYSVNENDAYRIAHTIFRWEGADAVEEKRDENLVLTSSSASLLTMGTFMGAWIEPVDADHTKVTIVTKRKVATNAVTTLTERSFHTRFDQAVQILKSGKPLPLQAP
jgi:hypothetical protein